MTADERAGARAGSGPGDGALNSATTNRTRGGWVPVGTSANRREVQATRGTSRGQSTRASILIAARRIFEKDGYVNANIDDIVQEAGIARGSFYTYFATKSDVFRVLSAEVRHAVDSAVASSDADEPVGPVSSLYHSNARYIDVYRRNAALYGLIEQVSTLDEEVHQQRLRGRETSVARVADTIARWQARGFADPIIEPQPTASALVSLTSNSCYWWFVAGEKAPPDAAATITQIWVRAVGLTDEARVPPGR